MYKVISKCMVANVPDTDEIMNISTKKEARKLARRLDKKINVHPIYEAMRFKVRKQD